MKIAQPICLATMLAAASHAAMPATLDADPETYRPIVRQLRPGDVLRLQPGRYDHGLRLHDLHGAPGEPIVIEGSAGSAPTVFIGRVGRNTVSLVNASHIEIRNLVLDGGGLEVDAVRAERRNTLVHHIVLENLTIVRHGPEQQTVAISTAAPTAFWTIRNNVIVGAGTGLYLGNPDGTAPFVAGVIEGNVIVDTTGYNLQIKHQGPRPMLQGMPTRASQTIIRGNVLRKSESSSTGPMARPNVLLGHFPLDGPGSEDTYRVEQNVFYGNPTEALLQAEGNITIEGNLFLNPVGDGISFQPHHDVPRRVELTRNFIAVKGFGVRLLGAHPSYKQAAERNDVRGAPPFVGLAGRNTTGTPDDVSDAVLRWLRSGSTAPADNKESALVKALGRACGMERMPGANGSVSRVIPATDSACAAVSRGKP